MIESINILLVEDDQAFAELLKETLSAVAGFEFHLETVQRLSDAANHLHKGETDAVLLDLSLPDSTGLDTLSGVQKAVAEVPVIILTGLEDEVLATRAAQEGAQDYFVKSEVRGPELARAIRYAIERKRTEERLRQLSRAVEQSPAAVFITSIAGSIEYVNPKFEQITGYSSSEVLGRNPRILNSGMQSREFYEDLWARLSAGREWSGEFCNKKKDGDTYWVSASISPVQNQHGETTHFVAVQEDITERKFLVAQLAQAQKLESIGQLAAGIAHEINTPTQYVGDNISFLGTAFEKLNELLVEYRRLLHQDSTEQPTAEAISSLEEKAKKIKLDFLLREIPRALDQSKDGVTKIAKIVKSMKEFSHPGTKEKVLVDLNHAIENTIDVARNEWKYVAEVKTDLDETLPSVPCLPAEMNQVILNILVNAAQAIGEVVGEKENAKGTIQITTSTENGSVVMRIIDDGPGIPENIRARIFDPFFTTKEVGKGTGQGLAIAHSVIVKEHGGTITCDAEEGKGSTFTIRLPIEGIAGKEEK